MNRATTVHLQNIFLNDTPIEDITVDLRTGVENQLPEKMTLMQNYPNPFNGSTAIQFTLPASAHVQIIIVNSLGQQVAMLLDEDREKGLHEVVWHGTDYHGIPLSSGCYFYILSSGETRLVKKMELLQ